MNLINGVVFFGRFQQIPSALHLSVVFLLTVSHVYQFNYTITFSGILAKMYTTLTYFFENNVNILCDYFRKKKSVTVYVDSHVYLSLSEVKIEFEMKSQLLRSGYRHESDRLPGHLGFVKLYGITSRSCIPGVSWLYKVCVCMCVMMHQSGSFCIKRCSALGTLTL